MKNIQHIICINPYRKTVRTLACLLLLMYSKTVSSQDNNDAGLYVYYLYNTQNIENSCYYYCSYSLQHDSSFINSDVEISIRNKEDLAIKGASAFFISNDNDTIKKISDSRGVIRIAFNTLSKHSRIYVNAANSVTDKYEEKIAYNTTIIDLHNLTTTNYRTNNHFAINKISVTLSHIKLNNTYYIIESQRPLDNKDIDCLRFDILLWKKNCAIWDVVTVRVCVDI